MPWAIMAMILVFGIIFELFLKQLFPIYRKPTLIIMFLIIFGVFSISFWVNQTKAFQSLCSCGGGNLKPIAWILKSFDKQYDESIKHGQVVKILSEKVEIKLNNGDILLINKNIICGYCLKTLRENDKVIVSGNIERNIFVPIKVKKDNNCKNCNGEINSNNTCINM